ncbi:hypothetical protein BpHYR1_038076 [Brachionus plicatilis]|uniref:Uncharacterized protein n=1 Tax=Brachionus plicatilis TaxID=10195 RepID=A0A3M7RZW9_BRAPC|nr:hypothetical protein BpHYR1_038076 [Brachionus plicatilis]
MTSLVILNLSCEFSFLNKFFLPKHLTLILILFFNGCIGRTILTLIDPFNIIADNISMPCQKTSIIKSSICKIYFKIPKLVRYGWGAAPSI